jgi:transposase
VCAVPRKPPGTGQRALGEPAGGRLSLDEPHHRRELATVVSDLHRRRVIEVLPGHQRKVIERWLLGLPSEVRNWIEVVSNDPARLIARRPMPRCRTPGPSAMGSICARRQHGAGRCRRERQRDGRSRRRRHPTQRPARDLASRSRDGRKNRSADPPQASREVPGQPCW